MAAPTRHIALLNLFSWRDVLQDISIECDKENTTVKSRRTQGAQLGLDVRSLPEGIQPWAPHAEDQGAEAAGASSPLIMENSVIALEKGDIIVCEYCPEKEGSLERERGVRVWKYPQPPPDPVSRLLRWYWMDAASLVPPLALNILPGQRVLDMCAAPGGKSLVLAHLLFGQELTRQDAVELENRADEELDVNPPLQERDLSTSENEGVDRSVLTSSMIRGLANVRLGHDAEGCGLSPSLLVCNEVDPRRRARLSGVLKTYLPSGLVLGGSVRITGHDGIMCWSKREEETFDRILIDAPCSSDRHFVQQVSTRGKSTAAKYANWSESKVKRIAKDQVKLVSAGMKALKIGGVLVYSTCR